MYVPKELERIMDEVSIYTKESGSASTLVYSLAKQNVLKEVQLIIALILYKYPITNNYFLFGFYGISTFVSYLMQNPFLYN